MNRKLLKQAIIALGITAVFVFAAAGDLRASLTCFKDQNGDGAYDLPGEIGSCGTTPQGTLCSLDATDCIIPSAGNGCPNLPNISYDPVANMCVVPPICPAGGAYDYTNHQCIVKSAGTCASGTNDATTGLCISAPVCSAGAYNTVFNQCIVTSPVPCPSGASFDGSSNLCVASPTCKSGSYSSTSNKCVDGGNTIIADPVCPGGLTLNGTTNRCELAPPCPLPSTYDSAMQLCVDTTPILSCAGIGVLNTASGQCEDFPSCPSGAFDYSAGVCIDYVAATCPPDGDMNTAKNRCEAPQGCTTGQTTEIYSLCLSTGPAINAPLCPTGTTFNSATNMCSAAPICPPGMAYNYTSHNCGYTNSFTAGSCPSGAVYSPSTAICRATPICQDPAYQVFDPAQHACVLKPMTPCIIHPASGSTWVGTLTYHQWGASYWTYICELGSPVGYFNNGSLDVCQLTYDYYTNFYWANGSMVQCYSIFICDYISTYYPYGYNAATGTCQDRSNPISTYTALCNTGYTFNPYDNYCETSVTCPNGYVTNYSASALADACANAATAPVSCPASTSFNSGLNQCETNPTCPTYFTFDPNAHNCQSTVRICPLGSSIPCQDFNNKKMCSTIGCVDISTAVTTTVPDPSTSHQTNNGTVDTTGNCIGQLVLFPGKPEYCRFPGVQTMASDCCSAMHGGKFSTYQDLATLWDTTLRGYARLVDATISNDTANLTVDVRTTSPNAPLPTHTQTPIVDGVPVGYSQIIFDPNNIASDLWVYKSLSSAGTTTVSTVFSSAFLGSTVPHTVVAMTQVFGNFRNDIYLSMNKAMGSPAYIIDTNAGTCQVFTNAPYYENDNRCGFVCSVSMSNGNLVIKVDYVVSASNTFIEQAAVVTKGPTGTSASIIATPGQCANFIAYGQNMYMGLREPYATTATSKSQNNNTFTSTTLLHSEDYLGLLDGSLKTLITAFYSGADQSLSWATSPCRPNELQTDIDRGAGKCHHIGAFCNLYWWHNCVQRKDSYCCFNSKLGRIIHEQGRPQLTDFGPDGAWGTPEAPNCIGMTPAQFQMLDFSKMDLSEFIADVVQPVVTDIQNQLSGRINNFYNNTSSQSTGTAP